MRPLAAILLLAISLQAQSVADAARKERERRANLGPVRVITSANAGNTQESKPKAPVAEDGKPALPAPAKEFPKPQVPLPADPVKIWTDELNKVRAKILNLQDQETTLQLQQSQLTNQVYAPVIDQATKDQALAQLGQLLQQLASVREDLDVAKKTLDTMQLQGPPKK